MFLLLAVVVPFTASVAQKKEMSQAKTYVKSGNNLANAESLMYGLLKDSTNRTNERIWLILFDAVRKQYEQCNEQLYLKQPSDTSRLFINARKMFTVLESLDSVEVANGKTPKYRKKHAEYLTVFRHNIYNGGLFFSRKQDYLKAFDFFDTYIGCQNEPLFTGYDFSSDKKLSRAAFMSMYCGYKLKDARRTMKYKDLAMRDTSNLDYALQYMAETYRTQNDTANFVKTLHDGFMGYPKSMYFFPRLYDYYYKAGDLKKSLQLCDDAINVDKENAVFQFARSTVMLKLGRYDECITICKALIAKNDSLADAYLNVGLAYYNQAVGLDKNGMRSRQNRASVNALYRKALPFMQRYRALAPKETAKWALPLYTIYLNLNMGKEFDEIDKLMKAGNK